MKNNFSYQARKKGQLFSLDFALSLVAFSILMIFIFSLWNLTSDRLAENQDILETSLLTFEISDLLVKEPGSPNSWEQDTSSLQTIGLASRNNVLDQTKVDSFFSLTEAEVKSLFNIKHLEYYAQLEQLNGTIVGTSGTKASSNATISTSVISVQRIVILNDEIHNLYLTIWRLNE